MESSVLEQSPTSPIISTLPSLSKSFVSMVLESDNQTNSDPLPAPPSPTSLPLSLNAELPLNEGNISLDDDKQAENAELPLNEANISLHDDNQTENSELPPNQGNISLDDDKKIEEHETYDYLPQDYTLTDRDVCAHIAIETSFEKQLLVKIDEISVK